MKKIVTILLILNCGISFAQSDSLLRIWNNKKNNDTTRLNALDKFINQEILFSNPDSAFVLAKIQQSFAHKSKQPKHEANALNTLGITQAIQGDLKTALSYFDESLKIREKINDEKGISSSLNNKGLIFSDLGDHRNAIEMFKRSLAISEKNKNYKGMTSSLGNLGIVYHNMGDFRNAIKYYRKSLSLSEKEKDLALQATTSNNIGIVHFDQKDYKNALIYLERSKGIYKKIGNDFDLGLVYNYTGNIYMNQLKYDNALKDFRTGLKIKTKVNDLAGIGISYGNIGGVFRMKNMPDSAMYYYDLALKYSLKAENMLSVSACYNNIGNLYFDKGNYAKAIEYSEKGLSIAKELELGTEKANSAESLWKAYNKTGNKIKAYEMFELYIQTRDTLQSEANQRSIMEQEFKYQYQTEAAKDSVRNAEAKKLSDSKIAQQNAEIKAKNFLQLFLFGGLALVVIFSIFIFNRFKVTQKQKKIIEEQKHLVDEKNQEITDSIKYAKRIQEAILPSQKALQTTLKNGFVLYKPKDIVAGDFYWLEKYGDAIYVAAADCTGHGVPGALVSVVCSNALSKALLEEGITETGKLLDRTRELVIERFSKSEENVRDGMDISLICLNVQGSTFMEETNLKLSTLNLEHIQWSGANNPLWIIRNNEIIEYKANKQPIGNYEGAKPFTTHKIEIIKGDSIYLITDGFQDQFGGEKGKKFKASKLKELLISVQDKSMDEQKEIIDSVFEKWRSGLEQNDDVTIIGIKI